MTNVIKYYFLILYFIQRLLDNNCLNIKIAYSVNKIVYIYLKMDFLTLFNMMNISLFSILFYLNLL